jgi:hypothetical protein
MLDFSQGSEALDGGFERVHRIVDCGFLVVDLSKGRRLVVCALTDGSDDTRKILGFA